LREVVVDRVFLEWAHHGIIRPECREAATGAQGVSHWSERAESRDDHLVHVRVRVPPVDESLPERARRQLAAPHRLPFGVERGLEAEVAAEEIAAPHRRRLREIAFGQARAADGVRRVRDHGDRLHHEVPAGGRAVGAVGRRRCGVPPVLRE
jgi:hypothetical protein